MRAFLTSEAAKKALFHEISLSLKRGCNGLFRRLAKGEGWEAPRQRVGMEDDLLDIQARKARFCCIVVLLFHPIGLCVVCRPILDGWEAHGPPDDIACPPPPPHTALPYLPFLPHPSSPSSRNIIYEKNRTSSASSRTSWASASAP